MPLEVEQIDLEAEIRSLETEMEETAEEQVEWEGDPAYARQLMQRGTTLDTYCGGLRTLIDDDGVSSVTLAGLTAGERNLAEDIADDYGSMSQAAHIAVGTREAPWMKHDVDAPLAQQIGDVAETAKKVADLPPSVMDWADERVGDLTHPGRDEGNGYLDSLRARMSQETQQSENG